LNSAYNYFHLSDFNILKTHFKGKNFTCLNKLKLLSNRLKYLQIF